VEPIALLSMATTAFKGVQTLVQRGREIEDVAQHLGRWYGYVADINEAQRESEKPPIFRKLLDKGSVEQEALNAIIVKKKIEQQEREIRDLIVVVYGIETYREMIQMRKDIRSKRERLVYKQKRRRRSILDGIVIVIGLTTCVGIVYGFYELLMNYAK
tara:strand:- start:14196 stop:14669 length:474 start_codon:yes stop_codon:yes gene_type:complete